MFIGTLRETHTKRQAAQHDCQPSLLGKGNGDKVIKKLISTGPTTTAKVEQNLLCGKPNEPTKE
jgi:hypothetical protein